MIIKSILQGNLNFPPLNQVEENRSVLSGVVEHSTSGNKGSVRNNNKIEKQSETILSVTVLRLGGIRILLPQRIGFFF